MTLYGQIIFHCMGIPFLIHSSVEGHLGYFYFFDIISNVARNICVTSFCLNACFQFSWVYTWGWNCWVICNSMFIFLGSFQTVLLYHYTFYQQWECSVWELQLLYIFSNTCYFLPFKNCSHPSGFILSIKWHMVVVLIFITLILLMLSIFSCVYWPFIYFL